MTHALGWVLFFVALIVSVCLHEAGHLLTAKRFGMKATQYFAGFGPTLWSFQRGETEYGVKAIPAGGFVKIVGMTDLEEIAPGRRAAGVLPAEGLEAHDRARRRLVHALRDRARPDLGRPAARRHVQDHAHPRPTSAA